jgi:hypothetical protein
MRGALGGSSGGGARGLSPSHCTKLDAFPPAAPCWLTLAVVASKLKL